MKKEKINFDWGKPKPPTLEEVVGIAHLIVFLFITLNVMFSMLIGLTSAIIMHLFLIKFKPFKKKK